MLSIFIGFNAGCNKLLQNHPFTKLEYSSKNVFCQVVCCYCNQNACIVNQRHSSTVWQAMFDVCESGFFFLAFLLADMWRRRKISPQHKQFPTIHESSSSHQSQNCPEAMKIPKFLIITVCKAIPQVGLILLLGWL